MSVFRPTKNTKQKFFFSVCYILSRRTVSIQQKSSSSSSWKMHSIISNTAHTRTRERTSRSWVTRSLGKVTTRFSWMNFSTRRRCNKKMFSKRDKSRLKNCPSRHKVILEWNNDSIRPSRSYHKHRWTLSQALRELFRCFSVS